MYGFAFALFTVALSTAVAQHHAVATKLNRGSHGTTHQQTLRSSATTAAIVSEQPRIISAFAGKDWIYSIRPRMATSAPLGTVASIALDTAGNLYLADPQNNVVLKVDATGTATVAAGNGIQGFSGDGGAAVNASLYYPRAVIADTAGNLYISEQGNQRIRKVSSTGLITTIAGTGVAGFSGDGGPAISARIQDPADFALDAAGNLYFAYSTNNRVRKIDRNSVITTVAGNGQAGYGGDGGPAAAAALNNPDNLAFDSQGNLYIGDYNNFRIRKVSLQGTITTLAGTGVFGSGGDGGQASSATITSAAGMAFDKIGDLIFADTSSCRIRSVSPAGLITAIAGDGRCTLAGDGGPASQASFWYPAKVAVDSSGSILVADRGNQRIRKFGPGGNIATVAGNGAYRSTPDGSSASDAYFESPYGIAFNAAGDLVVANKLNNTVFSVLARGSVSRLAGLSIIGGFTGDGTGATLTLLNSPTGIAVAKDGGIYYADFANNVVRRIAPNGIVSTVAGRFNFEYGGYAGDGGPATSALLNGPIGLALDSQGNLYIADAGNSRVRKVSSNGAINTVAGNGKPGFSGDGGAGTNAQLSVPFGLAVDSSNNLFIADPGNHRIRKLSSSGIITTIAGNGSGNAPSGEGGPALSANVPDPEFLVADAAGNLFYSDTSSNIVRKIAADGTITTVAGNGQLGSSGDNGVAVTASLFFPEGLALDGSGTLYIADSGNDRIRAVLTTYPSVVATPTRVTLSATSGLSTNPSQQISLAGILNGAPRTGLAYSADAGSASWLKLTPQSATLPQALNINVDATNLSTGTYTAPIVISAPGAVPSSISVPVTATVAPPMPSQLTAATRSLELSVAQGAAPTTAVVSFTNQGSGSLPVTVSAVTLSGGNWLSILSQPQAAANGTYTPLKLSIDASKLARGAYSGTITAVGTSAGQATQTVTVPVTLTVSGQVHVIQLSKSGLAITAIAGGGKPLARSFGVLNVGQGSMNWNAKVTTVSGASIPWLSVSPMSGTAVAAGDASPVTVSADPTGLAAGNYFAQVKIASDADNSPQSISVSLVVKSAGSPSVTEAQPSALVFTGIAGHSPGSQSVQIGVLGAQPVAYSSVRETQDHQNWLNHVPSTGTISPAQPENIVVQPDFTSLAPGIYYGSINFLLGDGTSAAVNVVSIVSSAGGASATSLDLRTGFLPRVTSCSGGTLVVGVLPDTLTTSTTFTAIPSSTLSAVVKRCDSSPAGSNVKVTAYLNGAGYLMTHETGDTWSMGWPALTNQKSPVEVIILAVEPALGVSGGFSGASPTYHATLATGATVPHVTPGGIVSSATFKGDLPVGVGGLVSIFGSSLADGTGMLATNVPAPTLLAGTQVKLQERVLPILYAADGQLNVQIPYDVSVDVPQSLTVYHGDAASDSFPLPVAAAQPAIFQTGSGTQGIVVNTSGAIVDAAHPASAGDTVVIYCTGLGPVDPPVATGAGSTGIARVTGTYSLSIGNSTAPVSYAGVTPGLPGLYQINAVVPQTATKGDAVPVVVTVSGYSSPTVTIAVR